MKTYLLWIGLVLFGKGEISSGTQSSNASSAPAFSFSSFVNDRIECPLAWWDETAKNTKFVSHNLVTGKRIAVFIELADKYKGACSAGLGMGCSIYDDAGEQSYKPKIVNHHQRQAAAWLQKTSRQSIVIVFRDSINWQSLAEGK